MSAETILYFHCCLPSQWSKLLKKNDCCPRNKVIPLKAGPFSKRSISQVNRPKIRLYFKTETMKVHHCTITTLFTITDLSRNLCKNADPDNTANTLSPYLTPHFSQCHSEWSVNASFKIIQVWMIWYSFRNTNVNICTYVKRKCFLGVLFL